MSGRKREDEIELIGKDALDALVSCQLPRELFGPGSAHRYLPVSLDDSDTVHAQWLADRPCPVIGIGSGNLADACDVVLASDKGLSQIIANIEKAPIAAMVLVQHLRASESLSLTDALTAESFAYATVQQGPDFLRWLAGNRDRGKPTAASEQPLKIELDSNHMTLVMSDPDNLNAIGVSMRDALCEALDLALADQNITRISIAGAGRCFSTGGEIAEFGEISDPASAHWIRSLRLPAWRLARLKDKLHIHVDGGAVGAGAEITAFGIHVTATEKAWFQLPELKYGLIPGAGGTASLPSRIGRQRTAYMALSMIRINAQTALDWGLVDEIVS